MPILSVKTPRQSFPLLRQVALKQGAQLDFVDEDSVDVYADIIGENRRILTVAVASRADILAHVDKVQHGEVVRNYPARPSI